MNRFAAIILLIILLISTICSCRTSKHSAVGYSDTTSVSAAETVSALSTDEILSLVDASRELELSGVKVEFFPPDSARPDSRPAPKSLTIEAAKAKETTEQTSHQTTTVSERKAATLSAQSAASLRHDTDCDNDFMRPSDRVFIVLAVVAMLTALSLIIFVLKRK